jgi:hypothetical protein
MSILDDIFGISKNHWGSEAHKEYKKYIKKVIRKGSDYKPPVMPPPCVPGVRGVSESWKKAYYKDWQVYSREMQRLYKKAQRAINRKCCKE